MGSDNTTIPPAKTITGRTQLGTQTPKRHRPIDKEYAMEPKKKPLIKKQGKIIYIEAYTARKAVNHADQKNPRR